MEPRLCVPGLCDVPHFMTNLLRPNKLSIEIMQKMFSYTTRDSMRHTTIRRGSKSAAALGGSRGQHLPPSFQGWEILTTHSAVWHYTLAQLCALPTAPLLFLHFLVASPGTVHAPTDYCHSHLRKIRHRDCARRQTLYRKRTPLTVRKKLKIIGEA